LTKIRADEEITGLPSLKKIEHMLAAGWGGTGTIIVSDNTTLDYSLSTPAIMHNEEPSSTSQQVDYMEIPAFLRRELEQNNSAIDGTPDYINRIIKDLNSSHENAQTLDLNRVEYILKFFLPDIVLTQIDSFTLEKSIQKNETLVVFIHLLAESAYGSSIDRHFKRLIRKELSRLAPNAIDLAKDMSIDDFIGMVITADSYK
jgi:hypothetical protein